MKITITLSPNKLSGVISMDKHNPNDPYFLAKKPDNPHQINVSDWIFGGECKVDIKLSDVDNTDQYEN